MKLNQWMDKHIFRPLYYTDPGQDDWEPAKREMQRAIRGRVSQTYKSGFRAGLRASKNAQKGGRA